MKVSYWGHFKEILNSKYIGLINYFVMEKRNAVDEIITYADKNNIPVFLVEKNMIYLKF